MPSAAHHTVDYGHFALSLVIDVVAIALFAVLIYFRRYQRKDLAVVFTFFNVGLMVAVTVIEMTEIAASLGFGLFAMLSIIRLRSEPFSNREIGYFFGALVLGLVNGIGTPSFGLTIALNVLVLAVMFVLDHPALLHSPERLRVTLDVVVADPDERMQILTDRLRVDVVECNVVCVDYVRDSMELELRIRPLRRPRPATGHSPLAILVAAANGHRAASRP